MYHKTYLFSTRKAQPFDLAVPHILLSAYVVYEYPKPKCCSFSLFNGHRICTIFLPVCYKLNGKVFAQIYPNQEDFKITLKCTADAGQFYRQVYPDVVVRGYHCPPVQQPYWNTIYLEYFSDEELLNMIDHAYDTVLYSFSKKVQKQILTADEIEIMHVGTSPKG